MLSINFAVLFDTLTPWAALVVLLAGILVGLIYVRRIGLHLTTTAYGYHMAVLSIAFFMILGAVRLIEDNIDIWEEWIASLILYVVYIIGLYIGKSVPLKKIRIGRWKDG